MEQLSDYEINISYHEGEANTVTNTLSRRPIRGSVSTIVVSVIPIDISQMRLVGMMARLSIQSCILEQIRATHDVDEQLSQWFE